MSDPKKPKPIPENYQRIEGSERHPASGERWVREADLAMTTGWSETSIHLVGAGEYARNKPSTEQ
jgi:hypothetical protein